MNEDTTLLAEYFSLPRKTIPRRREGRNKLKAISLYMKTHGATESEARKALK